ncbi:hypothetical protein IQ268_05825 [Oculatella sp. LEGE 06141]|uniref:hypothetical protein n=1 Tax=Oculatella sp. LEGE 06141 TaxID=1828648 RepID=UPI00187DFC9C|nr:hypothetical protein [Oculatella sp. LEGE 06141]MBE9178104.1 hypothetical protein [Oculatella sp. LEGE 06141]
MSDRAVQTAEASPSRYQLYCVGLPLAVYREVAAHLRQVTGVDAGLLPQTSHQFDYHQSQVGSLWIQYTATANAAAQQRVAQILEYYSDRYGAWNAVNPRSQTTETKTERP